jgi:hypothetical protein
VLKKKTTAHKHGLFNLASTPGPILFFSIFLKGWIIFFLKKIIDNALPTFCSFLENWGFGFFQFKTHS